MSIKDYMEQQLGTIENLHFNVAALEFKQDKGYEPDMDMSEYDKYDFADMILEARDRVILPIKR